MTELVIKDLHVSVEDKEILKGLNLTIRSGERHALMGPNGNGKNIPSHRALLNLMGRMFWRWKWMKEAKPVCF